MILYEVYGCFRRSLIKAGLFFENILYDISGGKLAKHCFDKAVEAHNISSKIKILKSSDYSTDIAKTDPSGNICDDTFRIISTSDFHLEDDCEINNKTLGFFARQIMDLKPDLAVITGDVVQTKYQQIDVIRFARLMEKLGVYWTIVFGNHEVREEKGIYKWMMAKSVSLYPHCLCKTGPDSLYGYANHTVNIFGVGGKLLETLFFFDSGRDIRDNYRREYNLPDDLQGYDFLKKEQIDFYENEVKSLKNKYGDFDSIMYMHIPLCEYTNAFKSDGNGGFIPTGECEILYGEQHEGVACSPVNTGMFDAILRNGSTRAVFAGHDHVNNWCALYKGVYLVYSLSADYKLYHLGTMFSKPEEEWLQGVTVTDIRPGGEINFAPSFNSKYLNKETHNGE